MAFTSDSAQNTLNFMKALTHTIEVDEDSSPEVVLNAAVKVVASLGFNEESLRKINLENSPFIDFGKK